MPADDRTPGVIDAIRTRSSKRAFLPTPVGREQVEAILQLAGLAPSGSNIQPWQVYVVAGEVPGEVKFLLIYRRVSILISLFLIIFYFILVTKTYPLST